MVGAAHPVTTPRRLNLGCGHDKREGWLNADSFPECEPDLMLDIEATPWPFEAGAFDHVLMKHVLEHVGADFKVFQAVMRELYRVIAPGGVLEVHVPSVRSDLFWSDPTHVRAFTPLTFIMLSKAKNREWIETRNANSKLALMMDVDFDVIEVAQFYEQKWMAKVQRGEIERSALPDLAEQYWNVAKELRVRLRCVK
jgi:predicted SAM-dependent methyltransferase